jgi:5-formyltetrahydrofolate cyclo-ligase
MPERIKKTLRQEVLDRRNAMPEDEREMKSRLISTRLIESRAFNEHKNIMFYVAFGSEPDCGRALKRALKVGKRVFVPDHAGVLEIKQPGASRGNARDIDLVIVPAIAFDLNGHRIGYGGGWYDRFSEKVSPGTAFIGVAFEEQIVNAIPRQPHDIKLDAIVTDSRVIICK